METVEELREEIKRLERKVESQKKNVVKWRVWYGELWELFDALNDGVDKGIVLNTWVDCYSMKGKR